MNDQTVRHRVPVVLLYRDGLDGPVRRGGRVCSSHGLGFLGVPSVPVQPHLTFVIKSLSFLGLPLSFASLQ